MIFRLAIVEDERAAAETLKEMMERYGKENAPSDEYRISVFPDAYEFLAKGGEYDAIFLDIQMDGMNGMQAAKEVRKRDEDVLIVFVTNMAQYAVESYDVQAYDFILKPLSYGNFFMKFRRVLKRLSHRASDAYLTLSSRFEQRRVRISDIVYVEVNRHNLIFHLSGDEEMHITGTMNEWEKKLSEHNFVRCNAYLLVNLGYVTYIRDDTVYAAGHELRISRSKKQSFLSEFAGYAGGSK